MDAEARSLLAEARRSRGLSLRELAGHVGISASQLSQIESGKSEPSVASLFSLVNQLGLSLDDLITGRAPDTTSPSDQLSSSSASATTENQGKSVRRVLKRSTEYEVLHLDSGVIWERLVASTDDILETLRVTYLPGGRSSSDGSFSRHDGAEFIHMISGVLTVQLRFETLEISGGDTLFFESLDPHYFINHSDVPAVGIWVILANSGLASSIAEASTSPHANPLHHAGAEAQPGH